MLEKIKEYASQGNSKQRCFDLAGINYHRGMKLIKGHDIKFKSVSEMAIERNKSRVKMSDDNVVKEARFWADKGFSLSAISKILECEKTRLKRLLQANNIVTKVHDSTREKRIGRPPTKEETKRLHDSNEEKRPKFTVNGITGTVRAICVELKIVKPDTAQGRIRRGWSVEDAVLMRPMTKKECSIKARAAVKNDYYKKMNERFYKKEEVKARFCNNEKYSIHS